MSHDPRIPEAEADVLAALFDVEEATARTLRENLDRKRPMARGSVVTLLRRLETRGLVKRRKADQGKAFVYRPARASPFAGLYGFAGWWGAAALRRPHERSEPTRA